LDNAIKAVGAAEGVIYIFALRNYTDMLRNILPDFG
jgi:hypothetical protein